MQIKIIEIRDRLTFIPAMAINLEPRRYDIKINETDIYYMKNRCGYACDGNDIILMNLYQPHNRCENNPYDWNDRTYSQAHKWITTNWYTIKDGDVIDVEFILGETSEKKISERLGG